MELIDRGTGTPLVLVPGIQGRWEYMRPAVDALSRSFRVITFALSGEPAAGYTFDRAQGLDNYVTQTVSALDQLGLDRAVICGVSFGGLVALRFAAAHPERTAALVLASTPAPLFRLRRRHEIYTRLPWIFGPLFFAETPVRLRRETVAALPERAARLAFARTALRTLIEAPVSASRMAERARLLTNIDLRDDCAHVSAPTLVVTGEAVLDYVVPVAGTSEYVRLIPGARAAVLHRTGHLGTITRPDAFAAIVSAFVDEVRLKPDTTKEDDDRAHADGAASAADTHHAANGTNPPPQPQDEASTVPSSVRLQPDRVA
jgi:pimeloyl-ACP methyl ester carboxylesterase